ncbi:hypothetical protein Kpol_1003p51 [Vanderwaltozyma polyspora DSM 70294]|uniref:Bacterial surface antigen (D15) domain-containing protein n=1 Tax=Vanderwaltozyma polyspora (strain ATCC 22028 / DSM 70294 / BCRC 21397 / CBS 2163 / NBRC 10782 / NRRL Y-8283 / UCD 57-17) TaxID=436907 RepID=A7TM08_VANPO|nr:uncharacterized protein Kpol_1003p51 [Vanderwaltozyma polyspora DSM 70294]EDO16745.1 hypothetical protein Kpol_1003p51 [Vanderwaltozyma polyspora DSM 70294]
MSTSTVNNQSSLNEELHREQHKKYITDIFNQNAFTPIKLSSVLVDGGEQVRDDLLQKYVDSTLSRATNFKQLCNESDNLAKKLVQHGIVEDISQNFTTRGSVKYPLLKTRYPAQIYRNSDVPDAVSVVDIISHIKLIPLKKFMAKTGTNIGNGEGDGYLQFQFRNIFGGGEQLKLDITKGTATHSSYLLSYTQPVTPNWVSDSIAYKNSRQLGTSIDMIVTGLRSSVRGNFDDFEKLKQEFYLEGILRKTKLTASNCSDSLLFQAGSDAKLTIGHSISWDTRDVPVTPNKGNLLKISNELALNQYFKSQMEFSSSKSWYQDNFFTLMGTYKFGWITKIDDNDKPLHISDKFHLGGSNDVRGFQLMGLGPKQINDAIGGDMFSAYGISLFSKLPFKKFSDSNFRLHAFFNGGKLVNQNTNTFDRNLQSLFKENSLAIGTGIIFKHPVARFELNFTLPLTSYSTDHVRKGFQYGIGMSFL